MPRTVTRDESSLFLPEGGVEFADCRASEPTSTVVFRVGTTLKTGLHWHEDKTEYLQVTQGHALITVGDRTAVFSPKDGVVTIPRFTIHQYSRADDSEEGAASQDIDLLVTEWTDPNDGDKAIFFRNVISCIKDKEDGLLGGLVLLLSLFVVMHSHDNYPLLWSGPKFLGGRVQLAIRRIVTHGVLKMAAGVGYCIGLKGTYSEYTPTS
ncbi:hypothetical protein EDB81DRAFT_882078 [Dactylonectria macrodidyma]|uniref:Cupin 2 conserved barrel domain-containing protein n=1 Tax=Dactylonectria macrodidyma TaxID=307937 RepID=A0A9P9JDJ8_9HYPO|nr:hypothetical protein EDB81DRAFT_882078 [Dactylonectria macrodidyma]